MIYNEDKFYATVYNCYNRVFVLFFVGSELSFYLFAFVSVLSSSMRTLFPNKDDDNNEFEKCWLSV